MKRKAPSFNQIIFNIGYFLVHGYLIKVAKSHPYL